MLVLPFLVVAIGLGPAIAVVVLGWMTLISQQGRPAWVRAGLVAVCSGVAVQLFSDQVANMILPTPLLFRLF
jgi:hypothetical protein